MAAPSPTLFALHNTIESRGFENLCVELLNREGYFRIIPGGKSRDHGRDTEVRYWVGEKEGAPQIAFQFSMEVRWEPKIRADLVKVLSKCKTIHKVVFVSSQSITIEKQDKLREEFSKRFGVQFEVFDEGWFRVRLEEAHVDLAAKHLGVETQRTPSYYASQVKIFGLSDQNQKELLQHTSPEALLATLLAQAKADPENASARKGVANVRYFLGDYDNANRDALEALKLTTDELERRNLVAMRGAILAEQGIQSGSRLLLNKARELIMPLMQELGRSIDFYNLGNILGALDELEAAESHYRRCVELDPWFAPAWKNLGSVLINLGRMEEGIECLDKALELEPELLEAICTKANVLVMSSTRIDEAIALIERAFKLNPDLDMRWPYSHYWYAMALCKAERFGDAWEVVEEGLERKFDCPYLGRLSNDLLARLWKSDASFLPKAVEHFTSRLDSRERDHQAICELLQILLHEGGDGEPWQFLDRFLGLEELSIFKFADRASISLGDMVDGLASVDRYRGFRESSPLVDYARILDQSKLRPHDDVPEILFYLLLPAYCIVNRAIQPPGSEAGSELDLSGAIIAAYRLVSRVLASLGGCLMATTKPSLLNDQTDLIARAVILGADIPLMEISRLIGYSCGLKGVESHQKLSDLVAGESGAIHEEWITTFLYAVGEDWEIGSWRQ